jgi:putative ABC transport system ATP-binding protein
MISNELCIEVQDMVFTYKNTQNPCMNIASFKVLTGDSVFIHGASGSGKSTLLGLLGGILTPQNGSIRLLNNDFSQKLPTQKDRIRADHIGFIFQQFNLIPYLSVIENVLLPCQFSTRRLNQATSKGNSLQQEAERLLRRLNLQPNLWQKPVTQLSVGQQQRVAAARAFIGQPEIIIADEPTSALDADTQLAFLDLLLSESAESNATLLFVSHDRRLASQFNQEIDLNSINNAHAESANV